MPTTQTATFRADSRVISAPVTFTLAAAWQSAAPEPSLQPASKLLPPIHQTIAELQKAVVASDTASVVNLLTKLANQFDELRSACKATHAEPIFDLWRQQIEKTRNQIQSGNGHELQMMNNYLQFFPRQIDGIVNWYLPPATQPATAPR